jgi:hypothetical protein
MEEDQTNHERNQTECSIHHCVLDSLEQAVGISTYLHPEISGFSAVSKARYSDFIVHEGTDFVVPFFCLL